VRDPPASLADIPVAPVTLDPSTLLRVSSHGTGEPHFGRNGCNRFDDGRLPAAGRFGTCYLGRSLTVALAETLLHDEVAVAGRCVAGIAEALSRFVADVRDAGNLAGPGLDRAQPDLPPGWVSFGGPVARFAGAGHLAPGPAAIRDPGTAKTRHPPEKTPWKPRQTSH